MGALPILLADQDVDVVLGRWAAAGPRAQAAAERVGHVGVAECGGDPLQAVEQVLRERVR